MEKQKLPENFSQITKDAVSEHFNVIDVDYLQPRETKVVIKNHAV